MLKVLLDFWYFWLLIFLIALLRLFKPIIKGWFGEKTITLYLRTLPKDQYTVINDIILPTDNGTTQIDHIVVSVYGLFVIETKNYTGWIFGSEKSAQWTQSIYGKKNRFMNPLRQNYAHVKAIEARVAQYSDIPIISIVAFSPNCDLKVDTTSHVVYFTRICEVILSYENKVISTDDISAIVSILRDQDMSSSAIKKEHVATVVNKKYAVQNAVADGKCPKCAGTLVERHGKYGVFLGCSNFPKCRFTKQLQ